MTAKNSPKMNRIMKIERQKRRLIPLVSIAHLMLAGATKGESSYEIDSGPSIDILGISVDQEARQVTLRWTSNPEKFYLIEERTGPEQGWVQAFSGIEGGAGETAFTLPQNYEQIKLFRVRELIPPPTVKEAVVGEHESEKKREGIKKEQQPVAGSLSQALDRDAKVTSTKKGSPQTLQPAINFITFG